MAEPGGATQEQPSSSLSSSSSGPSVSVLSHVQKVADRVVANSPCYRFFLSDLSIDAAQLGKVEASLSLQPDHLNSRGSLHGSVTATLIDFFGGMAIATHGLDQTGVSLDIHVTYLSTAKLGEKVRVEAVAEKVGGSVAFTTITIFKVAAGKEGQGKETETIVAKRTHTKFIKR